MANKQLPGITAPDGSKYVTLTDGAGTLITPVDVTGIDTSTTVTPTSGTKGVLFNNNGILGSDSGFTYAGTGGNVVIGTGSSLNFGAGLELDCVKTSSASDSHGFVDNTTFSSATKHAYGSFSSDVNVSGSGSYAHIAGFQEGVIFSGSGILDNIFGFSSAPNISNGTVTNRYGLFANDAQLTLGGAVTNNYGIFVSSLSAGGTSNYAIYTAGSTNPVFFGGQVQYTNWNPPSTGTGPVLTIPDTTFYLKVLGTYAFSWGAASTALLTLGSRNSNGSIWMNTPSFNGSNDSGFGVSGSYNSGTNTSTITLGAYGVNSGGPFSSILNLVTTTTTSVNTPLSLVGNNAIFAGTVTVPGVTTPLLTTAAAITTGAGASAGTLLNAPAAGNPTKWFPINDNGTTRYVPAW